MIALISQRVIKTKQGKVDALEYTYQEYFKELGVELIPVLNNLRDLAFYFDLPIEMIILTGGGDVHPSLYGEKEGNGNYSIERDATEKKLMDFAIKNKIPVLGICRGMQFINVYFGGKLIKVKETCKEEHVGINHKIKILSPRLRDLIGNEIETNSYHEEGLGEKELSTRLKVLAESSKGIVEAFCHPFLPILGVQWHPERTNSNKQNNEKIIRAFLNKEFWKR